MSYRLFADFAQITKKPYRESKYLRSSTHYQMVYMNHRMTNLFHHPYQRIAFRFDNFLVALVELADQSLAIAKALEDDLGIEDDDDIMAEFNAMEEEALNDMLARGGTSDGQSDRSGCLDLRVPAVRQRVQAARVLRELRSHVADTRGLLTQQQERLQEIVGNTAGSSDR